MRKIAAIVERHIANLEARAEAAEEAPGSYRTS